MRLPRALARLNRIGINRVTGRFAGRVPPFAMLVHRGRRTGQAYHTPIIAFPCDDGFVVALTYGHGTDWERNAHAGGGELLYRGRCYRLGAPIALGPHEAGPCLPVIVRVVLRLARVDAFARFPTVPER